MINETRQTAIEGDAEAFRAKVSRMRPDFTEGADRYYGISRVARLLGVMRGAIRNWVCQDRRPAPQHLDTYQAHEYLNPFGVRYLHPHKPDEWFEHLYITDTAIGYLWRSLRENPGLYRLLRSPPATIKECYEAQRLETDAIPLRPSSSTRRRKPPVRNAPHR